MTEVQAARRRVLTAVCAVAVGVGVAAPAGASTSGAPASSGFTWGADQGRYAAPSAGGAGVPASGPTAATDLTPTRDDGLLGLSSQATTVPSTWTVGGSGFGHGVGMSQYGAYAMARAGKSTKQILAHYYPGTTYDTVTDNQMIRVNLEHQTPSVAVSSTDLNGVAGGTFDITLGGTTLTGTGPDSATFTRSGPSVSVSCPGCSGGTSASGSEAVVTFDKGTHLLQVDGDGYDYGTLHVSPSPSTSALEAVLRLRLHDRYLDHIEEMPWGWSSAALRAQAAAARAYALRKVNAGVQASCACNIYDSIYDQVFAPYPADLVGYYWDRWKSAVRASGTSTTGFVPRYNGQIIEAVYSSSNGGWTATNTDEWGTPQLPYLTTVKDDWSLDSVNPRARWSTSVSQSDLASAFNLPDVVRLDLTDRTDAWAVATATATSSGGATNTITGQQLRGRLGLSSAWVRHDKSRKAGSNRYATAVAVAKTISSSATDAVIASGEDAHLPDAAVSSPLARAVGGPLLLAKSDRLPSATAAELDRRASSLTKVYIVGGTSAVGSAVVSDLKSRGLQVQRLAGANRYETAADVATKIGEMTSVSTVVVAGGHGLPDALTSSGPAARLGQPILLTPADRLATAATNAMGALGVTHANVVGGTSSVGTAVTNALDGLGVTWNRLSGSNRYETAAAITDHYRDSVPQGQVVLTAGADAAMPDSLVAGSLGRLMVLTRSSGVPAATAKALQRTPGLGRVVAVGGTSRVPDSILWRAANT